MPTIRGLAVAALVIAAAVQATPAHGESGWTFYRGTWIPYTVQHHHSAQLAGRALMVTLASEKAAAVRRARQHRDGHLRELERLLRRAQALVTLGRSIIGEGVWGCVARWEEGGHNSAAGYFGMIYPPSSYPEPGPTFARQYGDSWWAIPYAAQLQVAQAIQRVYGWSAWGPHTRAMCGLG